MTYTPLTFRQARSGLSDIPFASESEDVGYTLVTDDKINRYRNSVYEYQLGRFTDLEGWPSNAAVFQNRLWLLAGEDILSSEVDDFWKFTPSPNRTVSFRIASDQKDSEPKWMVRGLGGLLLGGYTKLFLVHGDGRAVTASNISVDEIATLTSISDIAPARVISDYLFADSAGKRLFSMSADEFKSNVWRGREIGLRFISEELRRRSIVEMVRFSDMIFIVWDDGTGGMLRIDVGNQDLAYSQFVVGGQGKVRSAVNLQTDSYGEMLILLVERYGRIDIEWMPSQNYHDVHYIDSYYGWIREREIKEFPPDSLGALSRARVVDYDTRAVIEHAPRGSDGHPTRYTNAHKAVIGYDMPESVVTTHKLEPNYADDAQPQRATEVSVNTYASGAYDVYIGDEAVTMGDMPEENHVRTGTSIGSFNGEWLRDGVRVTVREQSPLPFVLRTVSLAQSVKIDPRRN